MACSFFRKCPPGRRDTLHIRHFRSFAPRHPPECPKPNGRSVWDILVDAGVQMTENAGCAACLGGPVDTFGRMNTPLVCISATNRNFPGRMGHKESQVFLASPATVAASALVGRIADPRDV